MGSGARPAAAPLPDREPSELVGLRLPQPAVQPAAGDAVARRRDALDGPPAGPVAAQPAGRRRPPAAALGRAAPTVAQPAPAASRRTVARRPAPARLYDATPRARSHGGRPARRPPRRAARPVAARDALKRRRANVLFVLALVAACSLFLAATTKAPAMLYVFGGVVRRPRRLRCVLGQLRQRELAPAAGARRARRRRRAPAARRSRARPAAPQAAAGAAPGVDQPPGRRPAGRPADRWSARRLTPAPIAPSRSPPAPARRYTRARPRGCSSVGRAQQSHC